MKCGSCGVEYDGGVHECIVNQTLTAPIPRSVEVSPPGAVIKVHKILISDDQRGRLSIEYLPGAEKRRAFRLTRTAISSAWTTDVYGNRIDGFDTITEYWEESE